MNHFEYRNNTLFCESVSVTSIAEAVGTPFYLYSTATLRRHFEAFDGSFSGAPHVTCFAVKSCSNLSILRLFAGMGGGADIVSGGELFRALKAGVNPKRIVYSGVGKSGQELYFALKSEILLFNVESEQELLKLQKVASGLGIKAQVSFRVNPDVDAKTHPYISTGLAMNKFGIPIEDAEEVYAQAKKMPNIDVCGVSCHIGSQLTEISPFVESFRKLKDFIGRLKKNNINISYLDLGGGLGIIYDAEEPPHPREYAEAIKHEMESLNENGPNCTLILEPGRVIVGNAGILVTRVEYIKKGPVKKFVVVDAGMNDFARPSLYNAFHDIRPVEQTERAHEVVDVVGPICETGDFLAKDQEIPACNAGDLIAVMSAGAYGFSMASNYNSRPRVAEVLVNGDEFFVIRERETYESLIAGEIIPDFLKNS
ncbi:MAG: diaminopimelate decarboxylase [Thermodesulfobacteriota bacterium]|nr:diaminopimelate decarboxylase [Thermodesulfobacteriota bacterium]